MNPMPMIQNSLDALESIVLRPKLTLSLSSFNRRTGVFSEEKCLSLCAGITALRAAMLLAGGVGIVCGATAISRARRRKKPCKRSGKPRRVL